MTSYDLLKEILKIDKQMYQKLESPDLYFGYWKGVLTCINILNKSENKKGNQSSDSR